MWNGSKMRFESLIQPLVLIVGPTGVGKTNLSILLAEKINGEIISADSRSFYRGMDIGTAKPSKEDMERVPHHLINIADPDEMISLNGFKKLAGQAIQDIHKRGRIPIMVGGTGQYIQAVLEGWDIPEGEPNSKLRQVLEKIAKEKGKKELHDGLMIVDRSAAEKIDPANVRRTIRAFEVIFSTGIKFSNQRKKSGCIYSTFTIGLKRSREDLYYRADQRIDYMITNGFEDEVRRLVSSGFSTDLSSLSAIGYKEMISVIFHEMTLTEAIVLMKKRTRIFIRRQSAWFKANDPSIHWIMPDEESLKGVEGLLCEPSNWVIPKGERNG